LRFDFFVLLKPLFGSAFGHLGSSRSKTILPPFLCHEAEMMMVCRGVMKVNRLLLGYFSIRRTKIQLNHIIIFRIKS
jgi:hypothetical protein